MLKLLAPLLSAVAGTEIQAATERAKRSLICYALISVLGIIGTIFLLIAAYFSLAARFGLINGALLITLGCATIAVIVYFIYYLLDNAQKKRLEQRRAAVNVNAALTTAAVASVPLLLKKPLLTVGLPLIGMLAFTLLSRDKKPTGKQSD